MSLLSYKINTKSNISLLSIIPDVEKVFYMFNVLYPIPMNFTCIRRLLISDYCIKSFQIF